MSNTNNWQDEKNNLLEELEDMKMLYETVAEHSSLIENELEQKNQEVSSLLNQLKKYLSPQLFQSIVGGKSEVSLQYKRKFLTIFFSDIVGFTEISDRADPEVLSELLNGYLNDMAQIANKHGGTIDKFIGDALMVFFGDPEYINDQKHAQDCCAMAIEMQQKNKEISDLWVKRGIRNGLKVRMGIHSGYCTVGNFGSENRMDYTIIGGNVNIASRLESLADSESIFISSVTKNLLDDDFKTAFRQELHVKGIHYPIEVYELMAFRFEEENLHNNPYITITNSGITLKSPITTEELKDTKCRTQFEEALKTLLQWTQNQENT